MEYISLQKFADRVNRSPSTIIKRRKEIPYIEKTKNGFRVLEGSRYPCPIKLYSIRDSAEKQYVLLKAISKFLYIDAEMLRIPQKSFDLMLNELKTAELITENHIGNNYGANGYDCTAKGSQLMRKRKSTILKELASIAGAFTGSFVAELV